MIIWKKDDVDLEKQCKKAQQGYGIERPDAIQGFSGYFGFTFGDVYVENETYRLLQSDKDFEAVVNACLQQFRNLNYGRGISKDENELNFENRLFFGFNFGLIGRYITRYGTLEIRIPKAKHTEIVLFPCSADERKAKNPKRLFSANVVSISKNTYRLDPIGETVIGEVWDGDLEEWLRARNRHYAHPEDISYYKTFPYEGVLDRNGISGDEELFVEFDDGDLCGMTFYYTKAVE